MNIQTDTKHIGWAKSEIGATDDISDFVALRITRSIDAE